MIEFRFGENLPQFRIRNGTRAIIERLGLADNVVTLAVRLDDGRLVEALWTSLVRDRHGRSPSSPRITMAYAGTAYSVQGRTSSAAVLYVAKPTDAREIYVGLTRHNIDAYVVAERNRLEAAVQKPQLDVRKSHMDAAIRERLFSEARTYAEKANVVDYVADRIEFARTGEIQVQRDVGRLNLVRVALSARRFWEAAREISAGTFVSFPIWRLTDSTRQIRREVGDRATRLVLTIRNRINLRAKERAIIRGLNLDR